MTRTSLPIAAAVAVSAALLLSACGGGDSDGSDKIQSSDTSAPPATASSAPPSATATTAAPEPNAPTFDLPAGVTVDIVGFDSADAAKRAVLRDAGYAIKATMEAEATVHTKETPNFKRYFGGARGAEYADSLISYGRAGKVATGTARYYQPVVTPGQGGTQVVAFCEDQSKAYDKDVKTGKIAVTAPSLSDFRAWSYVMRKTAAGDWQVTNFNWAKGAKKCQVA